MSPGCFVDSKIIKSTIVTHQLLAIIELNFVDRKFLVKEK